VRPEDGTALPDSRLVVADEAAGLRIIEADGTHRPFGDFAAIGYNHNPPDFPGGSNGVTLDNDDVHVLVTDIYTGMIYRVNTETEVVTVIYDHPFGINAAERDRTGAIWFTQSTNNTSEAGAAGLFADVNMPVPTGALFRLPGTGAAMAADAEAVVEGIYFANGLAFDDAQEHLYVAELLLDRVLRYRVDVDAGIVSDQTVYATILTPDNLAVDADDNLWVASPVTNSIVVVDGQCGSLHTVFHGASDSNARIAAEWVRRSHLGEGLLELFVPELWAPLPGALTGMFWSADGETTYLAGLGNALLRYGGDD
jgi:sugar lactone lactonase YvrE